MKINLMKNLYPFISAFFVLFNGYEALASIANDNCQDAIVLSVDGSCLLTEQEIEIYGLYHYIDSTAYVYDVSSIRVEVEGSLERFEVTPKVNYLPVGVYLIPTYRAIYNDVISSIDLNNPNITSDIADTSIVSFDPVFKSFFSKKEGATYADVRFEGKSSRIYFDTYTVEGGIICQEDLTVDNTLYLIGADLNTRNTITISNVRIADEGSLVLSTNEVNVYPEFDVSQGNLFLINITDGCGEE